MKHLMSMRLYCVLGALAALPLVADDALAACMDGMTSFSGTYGTGCQGDNTCWREKSSGGLDGVADAAPFGYPGWFVQCQVEQPQLAPICQLGSVPYSGTYSTACDGSFTCWRHKSSGLIPGIADAGPHGYADWLMQCQVTSVEQLAPVVPLSRIGDFELDPEAPAISQVYEPDFSTFPVPAAQGTPGEPYDSMDHFRDTFAAQSWYPDPINSPGYDAGIDGLTPQSWNFGYRMQALAQMYETTQDTAYLDLLVYMGHKILIERDDHPSRIAGADDLRGGYGLPGWGATNDDGDWGHTRTIFKEMSGLYVYPLLKLARMVYADPGLHTKYKETADLFYQLGNEAVAVYFDDHPVSGYEYSFYDVPTSDYGYVYFKEPSTMAGITCPTGNSTCLLYKNYYNSPVPTNMAFLLGRAILEIWKVENDYPLVPDVDAGAKLTAHITDLNEIASKLVQYFTENSRSEEEDETTVRIWNYWDVPECPGSSPCRVEDVSHGALVVDFLVQAHELGVPSLDDDDVPGPAVVSTALLQELGRTYSLRLDKLDSTENNLAYDLNGVALSSSDPDDDYRFYCGYFYILDELGGNVHDNCEPLMTDRDDNDNDLGLAYYIKRKLELLP